MAEKKIIGAREATVAVLQKAEELMKAHKHIGWDKLHAKVEKEGYSKEAADKIAGAVKAKVEKAEPNLTPPDGVVGEKGPHAPAQAMQPAATPAQAIGKDPQVPGHEHITKGPIKLAKFVGRMEHKRTQKAVPGHAPASIAPKEEPKV